ncbi:hypothetical protein BO71DRAFT_70302 [Aspergillus ellipticus CBS 707.79]|uniref:Uncharacterized protein n=1 Tax=Aspergillus ellipticus CBS 707.79 TaxID=1448320 RepID=A0A319DVH0_9EURO|nr:hypothetical protein BO71DRAFT_70302 [Aspergillus ellipticus CBS 707.79]
MTDGTLLILPFAGGGPCPDSPRHYWPSLGCPPAAGEEEAVSCFLLRSTESLAAPCKVQPILQIPRRMKHACGRLKPWMVRLPFASIVSGAAMVREAPRGRTSCNLLQAPIAPQAPKGQLAAQTRSDSLLLVGDLAFPWSQSDIGTGIHQSCDMVAHHHTRARARALSPVRSYLLTCAILAFLEHSWKESRIPGGFRDGDLDALVLPLIMFPPIPSSSSAGTSLAPLPSFSDLFATHTPLQMAHQTVIARCLPVIFFFFFQLHTYKLT